MSLIASLECHFLEWGWGVCQSSCGKFRPGRVSVFCLPRFVETQNSWCFMDVFPWASGQQEENSGSGRCAGDVLQLSLRVKEFCTSSGLRKKQLYCRGPRCSPTCAAPQLYPRIMKLILLKLNLISINYPPESLSHCWTELNSFRLLFPGLFTTRQMRCKTKFHQVKGESCVPAQCLSCCLILRLSLVSWLSRADGL